MNYIVFDLEWNQGGADEPVAESVRERIPFEIIEIGAVKCDDSMQTTDSFHRLIRPQVYHQMHHVTAQMLHLNMNTLEEGVDFRTAMGEFLAWCGEDCTFCTWGTQDLTELQRNMQYYGMLPLSDKPLPFYDVQKLYAIAAGEPKNRRGLSYAVEQLQIERDGRFHRAAADAAYTAGILQRVNRPEVMQYLSYDIFHPPFCREDEVKVQFDTYVKYISRVFATREEAFRDREVISSKCYLCHRNLRKKIRWFGVNSKQYYCVAYCDRHGCLKGKIRVRKTADDKVYIVKTNRFITESEVEDIARKMARAKENKKSHRESVKKAKRKKK